MSKKVLILSGSPRTFCAMNLCVAQRSRAMMLKNTSCKQKGSISFWVWMNIFNFISAK